MIFRIFDNEGDAKSFAENRRSNGGNPTIQKCEGQGFLYWVVTNGGKLFAIAAIIGGIFYFFN